MRTTRNLTRVALGAAAAATPLAVTAPASATGAKCGGSPEVCFYVENAPSGLPSEAVTRIDVYTNHQQYDLRDVYVSIFMLDGNGKILKRFGQKKFPILPRAYRGSGLAYAQVYTTPKVYCAPWTAYNMLGSPQFELSSTYACTTWAKGQHVGALFTGGAYADLRSPAEGETLKIK